VSPEVRRVALPVLVATVALVVALGAHPFSTTRIVAGYVLALAAVSVAALVRVLGAVSKTRGESQFERTLAAKPQAQIRPPELVRVERELTLGIASEGHLHRRLLPLLREAAAARGGLSRERLGDDAWELLRPDRPASPDRTAPGIPLRRLRELVARLESL
jgi:hypothetical protein